MELCLVCISDVSVNPQAINSDEQCLRLTLQPLYMAQETFINEMIPFKWLDIIYLAHVARFQFQDTITAGG